MLELVSGMPGFVGIEGFSGEDGSELAIARFESPEAIAAWREHPEHVQTRQRGREEFFASYDITIASVWRNYDWSLSGSGEGEVTQTLVSG
jgi:heme-degrading monooxygenase HmoA